MKVSEGSARRAGQASAIAAVLAAAAFLAVAMAASPVRAAEGEACAAASWSLEADRAALGAPDIGHVKTGVKTDAEGLRAFVLDLAPADVAGLPAAPERAVKAGTFAGYVGLVLPAAGVLVQVTLSEAAWIDLVRDGAPLKTAAFTGVRNCPFARKSVRFDVPAGTKTLMLQVSGAAREAIGVAVTMPK